MVDQLLLVGLTGQLLVEFCQLFLVLEEDPGDYASNVLSPMVYILVMQYQRATPSHF